MIGIFDSGYGGLTILSQIRRYLPQYDYVYLGDNARAPYGTRSFEVIYHYTLQSVQYLFSQGCRLVIIACNTASAKALRTIQMHNINPSRQRVLGVIRPTVESVPQSTRNGHVGVLATPGTCASESYPMELEKIWRQSPSIHHLPPLHVSQQPCTLWVPIIEAGEHIQDGANWYVRKYLKQLLEQDADIDTIILGCTHYPLLYNKIQSALAQLTPKGRTMEIICQGEIVARSLQTYLCNHSEIARWCSQGGTCRYLTTESPEKFSSIASMFLAETVESEHVDWEHWGN